MTPHYNHLRGYQFPVSALHPRLIKLEFSGRGTQALVVLRLPQGFQGTAKVENHCTKVTNTEEYLGQKHFKRWGRRMEGQIANARAPTWTQLGTF